MTPELRLVSVVVKIFLGIEDKLVPKPIERDGEECSRCRRILRVRYLRLLHVITGVCFLPCITVCVFKRRFQFIKRRRGNVSASHESQLINTVGAPLAVVHTLAPTDTYDRIETESGMTVIVYLVRLVIRHLLTPYSRIRQHSGNEIRSHSAEHNNHPVLVFPPVEVGYLVFIHIERADSKCSAYIITRRGDKLIVLTLGKSTALYGHHPRRVNVSYALNSLEIGGLSVKIVPSRSI